MSEDLRIEISGHKSESWYKEGDIVSGRAFIDAKKDIGVHTITATLQCKELVTVDWTERTRPRFDTVEVDYVNLKEVLFPAPMLRKSDNSDEWKIGAGLHEFKFRFEIPKLERAPPSWGDDKSYAKILWFVKVCVCKSGFHRDNEETFPIKVFQTKPAPFPGPAEVQSVSGDLTVHMPGYRRGIARLFDSEHKTNTRTRLSVSYPSKGISTIHPSINIYSDTPRPDLVMIQSVRVDLQSRAIANVHGHYNCEDKLHNLGQLDDINFNKGGNVDISQVLADQDSWNSTPIAQEFHGYSFRVRYDLIIRVKVKEKQRQKHKTGHSIDLVIKAPCRVLSPSLVDLPDYDDKIMKYEL